MTLLSMSSRSSVDKCPPGVQEVMGSIPVRDAEFFSRHVDQFTFHIYSCHFGMVNVGQEGYIRLRKD